MDNKQLFYIQMLFFCIFLLILPVVFSDIVEIQIEYGTSPVFSYEVNGVPVNFGSLYPDTYDNPAQTVVTIDNTGTTSFDVSISGDDFVSGSNSIGIENCNYNTVNNPSTSTSMSSTYATVGSNINPGNILSLWFWVDVPQYQPALNYQSTLYIQIE